MILEAMREKTCVEGFPANFFPIGECCQSKQFYQIMHHVFYGRGATDLANEESRIASLFATQRLIVYRISN